MEPWQYSVRLALCLFTAASACAQSLELITRSESPATIGLGDSGGVQLTPDGAWALFQSNADNLVPDDANRIYLDIFLRNLAIGEVQLVSGNSERTSGGNGNSVYPAFSADASYVVFESDASDLVAGDTNGVSDVFLWERATDTLHLISRAADGSLGNAPSGIPVFSADGRLVVFESAASNLVGSDLNENLDLFAYDREAGTIELITLNAEGTGSALAPVTTDLLGTMNAAVTADGRFVAFASPATNLLATAVSTTAPHLFVRDRLAGTNMMVSDGTEYFASPDSELVFSGDGSTLVFLAEGRTSVPTRVFRYDMAARERSKIPLPVEVTLAGSRHSSISVDEAGVLVACAFNGQVYLWDAAAQENLLVSATGEGQPGAGASEYPLLTASGDALFFLTLAPNLQALPLQDEFQLVRFDRASGEIRLVSTNAAGTAGVSSGLIFPAINADGSVVAFETHDSDLIPDDANGYYDLVALTLTGMQVLSEGVPEAASATANGGSKMDAQGLSWDGRFLVFSSLATDLVPDDGNGLEDVFLHDLSTGATIRLSTAWDGSDADGPSFAPVISGDGRYAAFLSSAGNLVTNEPNGHVNLFLRGQQTGTITRVGGDDIVPAHQPPSISADGRFVAFQGSPVNSSMISIYVWGREENGVVHARQLSGSGTDWAFSSDGRLLAQQTSEGLTLIEVSTGKTEIVASHNAARPVSFSEDGQSLVYSVPGGAGIENVVIYDLAGAAITHTLTNSYSPLLSPNGIFLAHEHSLAEPPPGGVALGVFNLLAETNHVIFPSGEITNRIGLNASASFSADGRWLAFSTRSTNVLTADQNGMSDTYLFDSATRSLLLMSTSEDGEPGSGPSSQVLISRNGAVVIFQSLAGDLVPADKNLATDLFLARVPQVDADADGLEDGYELIFFGSYKQSGASDLDGDGMSNAAEIAAGTDPGNPASLLRVEAASVAGGLRLRFATVRGQRYLLQRRTSLTGEWQEVEEHVALAAELELLIQPLEQHGFYRLLQDSEL